MKKTRGLIAPPHTPFSADGSIDLAKIESQAELFSAMKLTGVFVAGSTGEGQSLTTAERKTLTERWIEVCRGSNLKVIIQAGHNSPEDVRELCRHAGESGADAVAATAPSYFKPNNADELIAFLEPASIAAGDLPFYYYDIPMLTGVTVSAAEVLAQGRSRLPNLAGLKFTNPDLIGLQESLVAAGDEMEVLFGCDDLLLAALGFGCVGAVGVTYNFAAPLYHRIMRAFEDHDFDTARVEQFRAVRLIRILSSFGYLAASKAMMKLIGLDCGKARPPLTTLSDERCEQLRKELEAENLWSSDVLGNL